MISPSSARAVRQYLERYAEPEARLVRMIDRRYDAVVVIPVCDESPDFLSRLQPRDPCLVIVVVNHCEEADSAVVRANAGMCEALRSGARIAGCDESGCGIHAIRPDADVLLVDRQSPGRELPANGGVGMARKIGADLALAAIAQESIHSPWILNTDADASWPADYTRRATGAAAAALFPFRHVDGGDDTVNRLTRIYEASLHHYVDGLKYAGSPYAFQSIGSTMAVHAEAYAKVRGFPKRAAAEDFYLLNKLAKVGAIIQLEGDPVCLRSRYSDRVPFGTGAAVAKLARSPDPAAEPLFYRKEVFECLRVWLACFPPLWGTQPSDWEDVLISTANRLKLPLKSDRLLTCLRDLGAAKGVAHAWKQGSTRAGFVKHLHDWFDGFRTVKLAHALRDQHFPSIGYRAALDEAQSAHPR